jgi:hypothetical protein
MWQAGCTSPTTTFSLFGADPFPPKSLLATIALALAGIQVLPALWIYQKLPLAGRPPRPVPVIHRVTGFAVFALTIPVAVHCLIAYGVQLTSPRVAIDRRLFLLRRIRGQGALGAQQAAARLGAAGGRRDARHHHRRALVHLSAVVLQRLPPPCPVASAHTAWPPAARSAHVLFRGSIVRTAHHG